MYITTKICFYVVIATKNVLKVDYRDKGVGTDLKVEGAMYITTKVCFCLVIAIKNVLNG